MGKHIKIKSNNPTVQREKLFILMIYERWWNQESGEMVFNE